MNFKLTPLVLSLFAVLIISGCGNQGDLPKDTQTDYEKDVKPLIEEKTNPAKSRGSCNAIDFGSVCIDYIGSMWTEQQMKLNCQGAGRVFSKNGCPYSEVGGCRSTPGAIPETIAWSYNYGGDPITAENVQYASGACNQLAPIAQWVSKPEDLLK